MAAKAKQRRAIGIVRVSRVGGREGESFTSPDEQRQRIECECEREGLELIDVISELDVSGGTPLSKREGLRTAIERVEYFGRLLARLGVLRCGSRLGSMKMPRQNDYPTHRCRSTSDCDQRVTISAAIAEQAVADHVRAALANVHGRASAETNVRNAEQELADAQDALDAAVRAFDGLGDETTVRESSPSCARLETTPASDWIS